MTLERTRIPGVRLLRLQTHADQRGDARMLGIGRLAAEGRMTPQALQSALAEIVQLARPPSP